VGLLGRQEVCASDGGRKNETLRSLPFLSVYELDAPEVGKNVGQGLASADGGGTGKTAECTVERKEIDPVI